MWETQEKTILTVIGPSNIYKSDRLIAVLLSSRSFVAWISACWRTSLRFDAMADVVRFHLGDGACIEVCKAALAKHASVFAPLADETGPIDYGSNELQCLLSPLCPAARQIVPLLLRWFGAQTDEIFSDKWLLHSFAVAHLLGAGELMDAARRRAASHEGRPLISAIASLDLNEDLDSLRTCAEYGLDRYSPMGLVHAAAEADVGEVVRILVSLEDGEQPKEPSSVDCTVDVLDAKGRTALHVCAIRDSANAAKVLLEFSASLTALCDPPEAEADPNDCFSRILFLFESFSSRIFQKQSLQFHN